MGQKPSHKIPHHQSLQKIVPYVAVSQRPKSIHHHGTRIQKLPVIRRRRLRCCSATADRTCSPASTLPSPFPANPAVRRFPLSDERGPGGVEITLPSPVSAGLLALPHPAAGLLLHKNALRHLPRLSANTPTTHRNNSCCRRSKSRRRLHPISSPAKGHRHISLHASHRAFIIRSPQAAVPLLHHPHNCPIRPISDGCPPCHISTIRGRCKRIDAPR